MKSLFCAHFDHSAYFIYDSNASNLTFRCKISQHFTQIFQSPRTTRLVPPTKVCSRPLPVKNAALSSSLLLDSLRRTCEQHIVTDHH